jgi:tRNA modification GTPase
VINKSDLPAILKPDSLEELEGIDRECVSLSTVTGEGLKELERRMVQKVVGGSVEGELTLTITNARHFSILTRAVNEIKHARAAVRDHNDPELIAYDVRSTMDILGELTGQITSGDIMDEIFQNFCIGK